MIPVFIVVKFVVGVGRGGGVVAFSRAMRVKSGHLQCR